MTRKDYVAIAVYRCLATSPRFQQMKVIDALAELANNDCMSSDAEVGPLFEKSRTLTLATLREHNACPDQCKLFKQHFGASVEITPGLCESVASLFSWDWAVQHLLKPSALAEYERVTAPAGAEYQRVTTPARAEYERVKGAAGAEYECVKGAAWAEYERVRGTAWAEYERVRGTAWAEYERVRGTAWAEYERVTGTAWAEYERVTAPARAEYKRVRARAFAEAYISDLEQS